MFVIPDSLRERYALARFIAATENRLALTTAQTIARSMDATFSPVAIVGPPSAGKTHLLVGFGLLVDALHPGKSVRLKRIDSWRDDWEAAATSDARHTLRAGYLNCDVLLLDDVHRLVFLPEAAREELARILMLRIQGGQITVVASTRAPADDPAMDGRLRRCFVGGTLLQLGAPRPALVRSVVAKRLHDRGLRLDDAEIDAIVETVGYDLLAVDRVLNDLAVRHAANVAPAPDNGSAFQDFVTRLALEVPSIDRAQTSAALDSQQVLEALRARVAAAGGVGMADTLFLNDDKIDWADPEIDWLLPDVEELT